MTTAPGPPAPPLLSGPLSAAYGAAFLLGGNRLGGAVTRHYGPVVSVPILGFGTVVAVTDPVLVKQVLTEDPHVLLGGQGVGPAAAIYGSGSMFVQDEPDHLRRRKLLTPPLHGKPLASYVPIFEEATLAAMATWPSDRPFSMLAASRAMTLDVITRVIFGVDDPDEVRRLGHPFEDLLDLGLTEETTWRYVLRGVGGLRWWPRYARISRELDRVVLPAIAERRTAPDLETRTDMLSLMLGARTEDGEGLTDEEVRDDLITVMLAGHETTATTLAWLFDELLHNPQALAEVQREADEGGTDVTHAIINECLRLHAPVPFTGRVTTAAYELGGHTLPAGAHIVLYIDAINKNPATYDRPDEFVADRFLHERPNNFAWLPFGGGIKRCLGASFSMVELTTVLHTMLRNGTFVAAGKPEAPVRRSVVVVPRHGTRVRYRPRKVAVDA
ncbi:cytochrome P450 [Nocardioides humilatus]|uniref:Cytochrome P450 n=2 Tax=Nocardioides humilatus TaxID=2607660 RepID=A0A5B1LI51_9ACTN|nr:cytochrome P450 [Nocardioides humilatus]